MMNLQPCLAIAAFFLLAACAESSPQASQEPAQPAPVITLYKLTQSPAFDQAGLALNSATPGDSGKYTFDFEVSDFELGAQTEPKPDVNLANSDMGQHIHLIVDNQPYEAHYPPSATTLKLAEPGNHVVLAFLSRSYHESVKNLEPNRSFVLHQYQVGKEPSVQADLSAPHLFYSRPKGTYTGRDTEHLLLDFFLVNTTLSPDGNKVRATIHGQEFILDEWVPYMIDGLPMGDITIRLELIDANGQPIPGPYNDVTRSVTLEK